MGHMLWWTVRYLFHMSYTQLMVFYATQAASACASACRAGDDADGPHGGRARSRLVQVTRGGRTTTTMKTLPGPGPRPAPPCPGPREGRHVHARTAPRPSTTSPSPPTLAPDRPQWHAHLGPEVLPNGVWRAPRTLLLVARGVISSSLCIQYLV